LPAAAAPGAGTTRWKWLGLAVFPTLFTALMNAYEGIPLPVLLVLLVASALWVVTRHTPFGRRLYAIGGNREAALYSGVRIERHVVAVFVLIGFFAEPPASS
jgi:D-xylose transport system permease protein